MGSDAREPSPEARKLLGQLYGLVLDMERSSTVSKADKIEAKARALIDRALEAARAEGGSDHGS